MSLKYQKNNEMQNIQFFKYNDSLRYSKYVDSFSPYCVLVLNSSPFLCMYCIHCNKYKNKTNSYSLIKKKKKKHKTDSSCSFRTELERDELYTYTRKLYNTLVIHRQIRTQEKESTENQLIYTLKRSLGSPLILRKRDNTIKTVTHCRCNAYHFLYARTTCIHMCTAGNDTHVIISVHTPTLRASD